MCTHKNSTFDIDNPCVLYGILLCDPTTLCGFPLLCQGWIMFHVLQLLVAKRRYQFNNNNHKDYQRIVKLKYSTNFFIHTFCHIVQQLHLIHGSTMISPTWLCALSTGVCHYFAFPHLLSAPISYVVSSFVNSSSRSSKIILSKIITCSLITTFINVI